MNLSDAVNPSKKRCQRRTTGDVFLKVPANSRALGQQTPGKATLSTKAAVIHGTIINRDFHKQKLLCLAWDNLLWPQILKGVLSKLITEWWINLVQHWWTLQKWLTKKDLYFIFPVAPNDNNSFLVKLNMERTFWWLFAAKCTSLYFTFNLRYQQVGLDHNCDLFKLWMSQKT